MTAKKEGFVPSRYSNRTISHKGQITLFIILGIVLILALIIFFVVKSRTTQIPLEPVVEVVSAEVEPVRTYTLDCVNTVAKNGLRTLGEQGGFISTEDFSVNPVSPSEGGANAVQFSPEGDLNIPYWRYLVSDNKCDQKNSFCLFSANKPLPGLYSKTAGDNSVESQLARYINDNIDTCLNEFTPFYQEGFIIDQKAKPTTKVRVVEDEVIVLVEYPLEVQREGTVHKMSQFYVRIPLRLKKIYEFAELLAQAQTNYTFIERHTLNIISAFSSLDKGKLPPKSELVFKPGAYMTWASPEVKKKLEEMLMIYIPALQVFGTQNFERPIFDNDLQQGIYDQMVIPLNLDQKNSDFRVQFMYLAWWPIYMDMNSGSSVVKPDSAFNPLLPVFGLQRYSNTYDLSFPVVVKITDPQAFYGEGYNFMFALESNIRNNKPMKTGNDFKSQEGYIAFQDSLFCNDQQKTSADNTFIVTDKKTSKPIPDINLIYTCGTDNCYIGSTNSSGILATKLPICMNGIITSFHQDYVLYPKIVSTDLETPNTIRLDAYPYVEKNIIIKKIPYSLNTNETSFPISLSAKENSLLRLDKVPEAAGEQQQSYAVQIDSNNSIGKLRIVPGKYEVSIDVFLNDRVVVDDKICTPTGIFGIGGEKCEDFHVEFNDSYPSAGVRLTQSTTPVIFGESDVYSDKDIVFYVIAPTLPRTLDDLENIGQFTELSSRYSSVLQPRFVSSLSTS